MTPWVPRKMPTTMASGSSTYSVTRTRSAQKFPSSPAPRRAKPRMTAASTAMPTAAETKFWTVRPVIWLRYDSVDSPP